MEYLIIYAKHGFQIQLQQSTPFVGTYKAFICRDQNRSQVLMTLTEGSGLTKNGAEIMLTRTDAQNTLPHGSYYLDLIAIISDTQSVPVVQQPIKVKPAA